ncbi:glycosyltransferase family 4 protein [Ancylobacter sp. G4_0304]|uniref:glycosyltransferase family 4 protein n=1 Tax=Ancylobacter sp. G4_0304 TaxID=3114289 RepID=UPI0039C5B79B
MRCLFLAPLKPPDHPVPSGERTMARLFMKLLATLGYEVTLASELRTYAATPAPERWAALEAAAVDEVERLARETVDAPVALVFAYHVYYKAPDLIGPALARRLGVPYVVAEASRAPKRAIGPFAHGHFLAEQAIDAARLVLAPTENDRETLERLKPPGQSVTDLKPFLDLTEWPQAGAPRADSGRRLITVAMMRPGDKLASYRQLAQALARIGNRDWTLAVVGDGPARAAVEAALAPFGSRVSFLGAVSGRNALGRLYATADLFVWPGVNEAFGAVYLEAQAHGLPCLAGDYGGIPDTMRVGETGLLIPAGDVEAYAQALADLLDDEPRRTSMGAAAARFIATERTLAAAADHAARALREAGIAVPGDRA